MKKRAKLTSLQQARKEIEEAMVRRTRPKFRPWSDWAYRDRYTYRKPKY